MKEYIKQKKAEYFINKLLDEFCTEFDISFLETTEIAQQLKDLTK